VEAVVADVAVIELRLSVEVARVCRKQKVGDFVDEPDYIVLNRLINRRDRAPPVPEQNLIPIAVCELVEHLADDELRTAELVAWRYTVDRWVDFTGSHQLEHLGRGPEMRVRTYLEVGRIGQLRRAWFNLGIETTPPVTIAIFGDDMIMVPARIEVAGKTNPTTSRHSMLTQHRHGKEGVVPATALQPLCERTLDIQRARMSALIGRQLLRHPTQMNIFARDGRKLGGLGTIVRNNVASHDPNLLRSWNHGVQQNSELSRITSRGMRHPISWDGRRAQ
jgi:hypothetical protein